jgi:dGTPase
MHSLEDVRHYPDRLIALSSELDEERRVTKEFLYNNLYFSPSLDEEKDDAEIIVGALFQYWIDHPDALPYPYQQKAEQEPLARVICDYIAGMTDNFIFEQYDKYLVETH